MIAASDTAISIAIGLIKLGGRIDRLTAEHLAVDDGPGAFIPMPKESELDLDEVAATMGSYLSESKGSIPDPLGSERGDLQRILKKLKSGSLTSDEGKRLFDAFSRHFPEQAVPVSPDTKFLRELRKWLPSVNWGDAAGSSAWKAAFYVSAGSREGGISFAARIGLLVADAVAEFGAEHTAMFVRDENAQSIVKAVLIRFSKPDLENFDQWSPFVRHALGATLNGLIDSRTVLREHSEWAAGLLDAIGRAREQAPNQDEYVMGLLRGRGYRTLIGEGLQVAGAALSSNDSRIFNTIAGDLLIAAAPLVTSSSNGFDVFFKEHWADLLHGGINTLVKSGPKLLEGKNPLLRETLMAVVKRLAATDNAEFLSADTVRGLTEAAVAAVAQNPKLLTDAIHSEWLGTLITSISETLASGTLRSAFSRDGLERIVNVTLTTFAQHPEMIVAKPGIVRDAVGNVLAEVTAGGTIGVQSLADAAVTGLLQAYAQHPSLTGTKLDAVLAEAAGVLASRMSANGLSALHASDLLGSVTEAVLRNPLLFTDSGNNVAVAVLKAVFAAAEKDGPANAIRLLDGAALVKTASSILGTVARQAADYVAKKGSDALTDRLTATLGAGLELARGQLGRGLDLTDLPAALSALTERVLSDDQIDPIAAPDSLKSIFSQIAGSLHSVS